MRTIVSVIVLGCFGLNVGAAVFRYPHMWVQVAAAVICGVGCLARMDHA